MAGTQTPGTVSTKLERIAELAKRKAGVALRTLAHHIDMDMDVRSPPAAYAKTVRRAWTARRRTSTRRIWR